MYSISHLSRKLSKHYGAEGSNIQGKVRLNATCRGFQNLSFCKRRSITISIVTDDTILDISVGAVAKIVKESLRDGQKTELTEGSDRF